MGGVNVMADDVGSRALSVAVGRCPRRALLLVCLLTLGGARAGQAADALRLAGLFGDQMVLQQGKALPVWGHAAPGLAVTVRLGTAAETGITGPDGAWRVELPSQTAGTNLTLTVSAPGTPEIVCRDVSVGEVWLCGGQSNMAFPMPKAGNEAAYAAADLPQVRFFTVKQAAAAAPAATVEGRWVVCSPEALAGLSGTAYCFGREIHQARKVPVGLICSAVGGTTAEAWTSAEKLASTPALAALAAAQEARRKGEAINAPAAVFNGMIAPLAPFALRGVIWYQGEQNAWREHPGADYRALFPALIADWRGQWRDPELPFLYVQLPNWTPAADDPNAASAWGEIREAQAAALALPRTAMAVTIDNGDTKDIHPPDNMPFGRRLALAARGLVYGEAVAWKSPLHKSMQPEDGKIRITFDTAGGRLVVKGGGAPKWFAVAGQDRRFVWADARLDADGTVLVWSDQVPEPVAVRYAWWMNPLGVNLYSETGLPVAPFRTDAW
jgi:sialate O-acetylesterase